MIFFRMSSENSPQHCVAHCPSDDWVQLFHADPPPVNDYGNNHNTDLFNKSDYIKSLCPAFLVKRNFAFHDGRTI